MRTFWMRCAGGASFGEVPQQRPGPQALPFVARDRRETQPLKRLGSNGRRDSDGPAGRCRPDRAGSNPCLATPARLRALACSREPDRSDAKEL